MPDHQTAESRTTAATPVLVQQGKLLDFIDGDTQRPQSPEEYVRQEIAKSLVREYGYPRESIQVEFSIAMGSRRPRVDLAVFEDASEQSQQNATILVECKAPRVKPTSPKDGFEQLQSYMSACPNATYGMWTNSLERFCFRKVSKDGRVSFEDIPDIPRYRQSQAGSDRLRFDQLRPATSDALLFAFRRCHDYIAGNQGLQKPEAFWELLKLIFCKIYDERQDELNFFVDGGARHGINAPLMVQERLGRLFDGVKNNYRSIFDPSDKIDLVPQVLTYIVSQLQMYSLLESDIDIKGRAYEEIVGANLRGDRGEFFTPRNVCQMCVEMLDPDEQQLILDPACGTGGFLIVAMNHVIRKIRFVEENTKGGSQDRIEAAVLERTQQFARDHIVGIDLNPNLVKASKMNMVMNNDGSGRLYQGNSLAHPATWSDELRDLDLLGTVDFLFTNPPFGSKIPIDDPTILETYDLGHVWAYDNDRDRFEITDSVHRSQPPEVLFIERCVRFLKPGTGRMAIVVPDGILGSPGQAYVREWILRNCRVLGSIDLHADAFQPSVSIQASVLILERKTQSEMDLETAAGRLGEYPVFMALANHIGRDKRGNTTYVRDAQGNEIIEEFDDRVREFEDGQLIYKTQRVRKKIEDDNTMQIAEAFKQWLLQT